MAIIQQDIENGNSKKENITHFYKEYKLSSLLTQSNVRKEKGISLGVLFTTLLAVIFTGKSKKNASRS
jgi:hypothetical protein